MKTFGKISVLFLFLLGFAAACSDDDNNNPPAGNATLTVKLTDAPGVYDAVNVEILSMEANLGDGWQEFPVATPGVYNLIDFTNGNTLILLGNTSVEPNTMTELRLILGTNNTVVVDGNTYELKTPSGQTSGYKVKMDPQVLAPGGVYNFVLDFDASKSVTETGNGKYILNPVVTGYLENSLGGIAGTVNPAAAVSYVEAVNAGGSAGTIPDPATGEFLISTLLPGTYDVTFTAVPPLVNQTITGVVVTAGQVTQMGTINF
jgi:hypothetical protein